MKNIKTPILGMVLLGMVCLASSLSAPSLFAAYEFQQSDVFSVKVNGRPIFTEYYKTVPDELNGSGNVRWPLENVSMSHFMFSGTAHVEVTCDRPFGLYNLSPKRYGVNHTRNGNTIAFDIDRPIKLNINMDNDPNVNEQLFLFADALEDKPDIGLSGVKNFMDYPGADNSGDVDVTGVIQGAINGLSSGQTLYFPPGQYLTKTIRLKSEMTLYLEAGSMLLGTEVYEDYRSALAMVLIKDCQNTAIKGYGRINFRGEKMQADHGSNIYAHNIKIVGNSNHIDIEDIFSLDPPRLNIEVDGDYSTLYNVKALSTQQGANTDGINPWRSSHVVYDNVFIYGRDDAIAVKHQMNDFVARNSILSTLESPQKIGTETEGTAIRNIVFENNDVLYGSAGMSIWSRDGAEIDNIWYRNIGVERLKPSPYLYQGVPVYLTVLPRDESNPGSITDVHFQNVAFETEGLNFNSYLHGSDSDSRIDRVTFENLTIAGTPITNANYTDFFDVERYVYHLDFGEAEFPIVEIEAPRGNLPEGGSQSFTITRSGDTAPSFTVEYWIRGTAKDGIDFDPISNTVTFGPGETSKTVSIVANEDGTSEGIEQVYLSLKSHADQAYMLGPRFNAMINIQDAGETGGSRVISDPPFPGTGPQVGDFDYDGDVDGADLLVWQRGSHTAEDLEIWRDHFGSLAGGLITISPFAVPEPASAALLLLAAFGLGRMER